MIYRVLPAASLWVLEAPRQKMGKSPKRMRKPLVKKAGNFESVVILSYAMYIYSCIERTCGWKVGNKTSGRPSNNYDTFLRAPADIRRWYLNFSEYYRYYIQQNRHRVPMAHVQSHQASSWALHPRVLGSTPRRSTCCFAYPKIWSCFIDSTTQPKRSDKPGIKCIRVSL